MAWRALIALAETLGLLPTQAEIDALIAEVCQ